MRKLARKWDPEEIQFIIENNGRMTNEEIGRHLNRCKKVIQNKRRQLGLARDFNPWTAEEDAVLKELVKTYTIGDVAKKIGRSYSSVEARMRRIGIQSPMSGYNKKKWTREEINTLYEMASTSTQKRAAKELNRSKGSVQQKSRKLGINWQQGRISLNEISRVTGLGKTTIQKVLKKKKMSGRRITDSKIFSDVAKEILSNPRSFNRCHASLKQLEAAERGNN